MLKGGEEQHVLVTGAGGYIASWIVKYLLAEGYHVHAAVRSAKQNEHLSKEHLGEINGEITLFEGCDLLKEGSFDEAMKGCSIVFHTASPFLLNPPKDKYNALIVPALKGTENVLNSCTACPTVKQVILTASIATVASFASRKPDGSPFDENDWNTTDDISGNAYAHSKYVAEKRAWEIAKAQSQWTLTTIHPGFCFGPVLSSRANDGSIGFMKKTMNGEYFVSLTLSLSCVDVRDVAKAHVLAITKSPQGEGGRYIVTDETLSTSEIAKKIDSKYRSKYWVTKYILPKFMAKLIGPLLIPGTNAEYFETCYTAPPLLYSNQKVKNDFGMTFTKSEVYINDMIESLIQNKIL